MWIIPRCCLTLVNKLWKFPKYERNETNAAGSMQRNPQVKGITVIVSLLLGNFGSQRSFRWFMRQVRAVSVAWEELLSGFNRWLWLTMYDLCIYCKMMHVKAPGEQFHLRTLIRSLCPYDNCAPSHFSVVDTSQQHILVPNPYTWIRNK